MRRASSPRVSATCFPRRSRTSATCFRGHPAGALRQLPGRAAAAADLLPDGAALGPRRARRLRPAHDQPPAARHAAAHRPDAGRLRRPPGGERRRRGRGADDRRLASTSPPSTPAAIGTRTASSASPRSARSRSTARPWSTGTAGRRAAAPGRHRDPPERGHPAAADSGCGQAAPGYGSDPHSYPRNDVKARAQKSDFLRRRTGLSTTTAPPPTVPDPASPCAAVPEHRHRDPLLLARLARPLAATKPHSSGAKREARSDLPQRPLVAAS